MNIAISKISGILKKSTEVLIIALVANLAQAQTTINADSLSRFENISIRVQLGIPDNGALLNINALERRNKLKGINYVSLEKIGRYKIDSLIKSIQLFAKRQDDTDLALEMELLNLKYNLSNQTPEFILQRLLELDSSTEAINKPMHVQFKYLLGSALMSTGRFSEGLYELFNARHLLKNGISDPETQYDVTNAIANYAYRKQRFNLSKNFFKECINTRFNSDKSLIFNNLGLSYSKLGILDSSYYYYQIAKEKAIANKNSVMLKVINGNIGEILYKQGSLEAAIPLIQEDAEMCLSVNSFGNASNALVLLSDIYLQLGNNAKAETLLFQALANARKINDLRRMEPVYKQLSKWYAVKGNATKTLIYADSASYVVNKLNEEFFEVSSFDAEKSIELNISKVDLLRAKQLQLVQKQENRIYLIIFIALAIILPLVGLIISLYIKKERLRRTTIEIKNIALEEQLTVSRLELDALVESLLAQSLKKEFKKNKISTKLQLDEFKILFNDTYPLFSVNLEKKHSNLTKSEKLLFCFTMLDLPDDEISMILGVNTNTVTKTRSRVMQKLNIKGVNRFRNYVKEI
jgi:DNA-binding CsgD family transcriptional regulator